MLQRLTIFPETKAPTLTTHSPPKLSAWRFYAHSLRYGNVPLMRQPGGLTNMVEGWENAIRTGTAFVFGETSSEALVSPLRHVLQD